MLLDGGTHVVTRRLDLEVGLLRVRQRDPGRCRVGQADGLLGIGQGCSPLVLRDVDDRAQRIGKPGIGILGDGLVDARARLVDPPHGEQVGRALQ